MATVTGLTAERMLEIEGSSVVEGEIVDGNLMLQRYDGTLIDAGPVLGPQGVPGPPGPPGGQIPGEIKMWPGAALPDFGQYGRWVWADGGVYVAATYPKAYANIAPQWRTFGGASDPGASNFRVPDLRGLAPVGMDAMPGGARANRVTRSVAIVLAGRTGTELHVLTVPELAPHAHGVYDPGHQHPGTTQGAPNTASGVYPQEYPGGYNYASPVGYTGIGIYNAGGGGGHETMQPSVFVPYIVKLDD